MSLGNIFWTGGASLIVSSALLLARPTGSGSDTDTAKPPRRTQARLIKPYSELTDLTESEKSRIIAIHQKALEQIHSIEAREKQDIEAVLTAQQKKELAAIESKDREAARERRSRRPTTQPTGGGESSTGAK